MNIKTKLHGRGAGFTLVEIMIVVAIIGLLAAIAVPNYVRARTTSRQNVCINNLRQIDAGIQQLLLEDPTAAINDATVTPFLKSGASTCPAGGFTAVKLSDTYNFGDGTAANPPRCTVVPASHLMP